MTKNKIPNTKYAALSNLEDLQREKIKLRAKLRDQEVALKSDVDDFMEMFRFWGSLASIAKQISSAIPFLSSIKLFLKLIGFFSKKL